MKWVFYIAGGLAGVLLLGCAVLFALRFRPGAGTMRASTMVEAPADAIWPWLREPEKLKQWVSWMVEARDESPTRQVWIMEDRNNNNQRMRIEGTLILSEPPSKLVIRTLTSGQFEGTHTYLLAPEGAGRTRLTVEAKYNFEQAFVKLLEPLILPQAEKKLVRDLEALKQRVEAAP